MVIEKVSELLSELVRLGNEISPNELKSLIGVSLITLARGGECFYDVPNEFGLVSVVEMNAQKAGDIFEKLTGESWKDSNSGGRYRVKVRECDRNYYTAAGGGNLTLSNEEWAAAQYLDVTFAVDYDLGSGNHRVVSANVPWDTMG